MWVELSLRCSTLLAAPWQTSGSVSDLTDSDEPAQAKWGFLAAIFLFELGSLICAAAPTSAVLVGGR